MKKLLLIIMLILSGCSSITDENQNEYPKDKGSESNTFESITVYNELTNWYIKIPQGWESLTHNENTISIGPKINKEIGCGDIFFSVYYNPDNLEYNDFYKKHTAKMYSGTNIPESMHGKEEEININGQKAVKFYNIASMNNEGTAILMKKDEYIIELFDIGNKYQENGIFEKIINSISFE